MKFEHFLIILKITLFESDTFSEFFIDLLLAPAYPFPLFFEFTSVTLVLAYIMLYISRWNLFWYLKREIREEKARMESLQSLILNLVAVIWRSYTWIVEALADLTHPFQTCCTKQRVGHFLPDFGRLALRVFVHIHAYWYGI